MRVTFAAMGCESISLEYLSAFLKNQGHEVNLAYDPALFDDKNYFYKPILARFFSRKKQVIEKIIAQSPDVVGFSVFASNYHWAIDIAAAVKERTDSLVVFGGIHPTTEPEEVLSNDCVDVACRDEGEAALSELLESLEQGTMDTSIRNLWFKQEGKIIRNPVRDLVDLNTLPMPDKTLFENDIPMQYMYLTVTSKGCPFACSFCSNSFLKRFQKGRGRFLRERSVKLVMDELLYYKDRYNYQWVDIKNNTFSATKSWTLDFLERYANEVKVPLRVMGHPKKIDDEIASAMKRAGVWRVQLGVESLDENLRHKLLKRKETNEEIIRAMDTLERHRIGFSIDQMVGLPGQSEDDLVEAANIFARYKRAVRITPFWLQYLTGTDLLAMSLESGTVDESVAESARKGLDHHYIYQGSVSDEELIRTLRSLHVLFRLAPSVGKRVTSWLSDKKRYRIFRYLPMDPVINLVDFFASFIIRDLTSISYIKTYGWTILRIITKGTFPKTKYKLSSISKNQ